MLDIRPDLSKKSGQSDGYDRIDSEAPRKAWQIFKSEEVTSEMKSEAVPSLLNYRNKVGCFNKGRGMLQSPSFSNKR